MRIFDIAKINCLFISNFHYSGSFFLFQIIFLQWLPGWIINLEVIVWTTKKHSGN